MKKILFILISLFFVNANVSAMIAPEYMLENINNSKIKTPAVIKKVKTIQNNRGNRTQKVTFTGLYNNENVVYEGICHNFKKLAPWDIPMVGLRYYYPKKGERVFVTIEQNGGEITSLIIMDKDFENKIKNHPSKIKYDSSGAYFE